MINKTIDDILAVMCDDSTFSKATTKEEWQQENETQPFAMFAREEGSPDYSSLPGQFLSPEDMKYQAEKVAATGNRKIFLTERGSTFGYNNLVVDMRGLVIMRRFGYPVIFDATHSIQMPSKDKGVSGGTPEFIPSLARAAAAVGVDGFFIETHPEPKKALSDASSMIKLDKMEELLKQLKETFNISKKYNLIA